MYRLRSFLTSSALLRRTALASLVANVGIVITGGVVRLTGSGMGCPSWPRCDDSSLVPTPALGIHGMIEFGNRTLISVVGGLALASAGLALLHRPWRRDQLTWAGVVVAGVVGQAVLGGVTVRTVLNPWIVSAHFLLSMVLIAAAYRFWLTTRAPVEPAVPALSGPVRALAWLITGVSAVVLAVGTVVTGSGPHAGDAHARRTGLNPASVAQLHADLVMLLVGLSIALVLFAPAALRRAAAVLVLVELAQGLIGLVQYLTALPVLLVGLHMAGACAVWLATLAVAWRTRMVVPSVSAAVSAPDVQERQDAQERSAPSRATIASASRLAAPGA